jgi:type III pantothenate kinase
MPDEYGMMVMGFFRHEGLDPTLVDGICMASVVPPLTKIFTRMCERYFERFPLVVKYGIEVGIEIRIDNPSRVGADRIVDAVAVHHLYGGPACIVDLGTATTFDAVSREGHYLGGAIAPGIAISADALFLRTAKLPRVEFVKPPGPIGRNTVHAIRSGLLYGYLGLIEGMVARFRTELGPDMKVIATGGLARAFAEETDVIDHINPWLTLEGLRLVWNIHNGKIEDDD